MIEKPRITSRWNVFLAKMLFLLKISSFVFFLPVSGEKNEKKVERKSSVEKSDRRRRFPKAGDGSLGGDLTLQK